MNYWVILDPGKTSQPLKTRVTGFPCSLYRALLGHLHQKKSLKLSTKLNSHGCYPLKTTGNVSLF